MPVDLNLLTALDALLEERSVMGAAERLHLSAPAVSRTLGRLRKLTGDDILVRTPVQPEQIMTSLQQGRVAYEPLTAYI